MDSKPGLLVDLLWKQPHGNIGNPQPLSGTALNKTNVLGLIGDINTHNQGLGQRCLQLAMGDMAPPRLGGHASSGPGHDLVLDWRITAGDDDLSSCPDC